MGIFSGHGAIIVRSMGKLYAATGKDRYRKFGQTVLDRCGRTKDYLAGGDRIKLSSESGKVQYNHVTTSVGYLSSSDKRVHFGLGADRRIREIELRWPSGKVQVVRDVAANQVLKVREE